MILLVTGSRALADTPAAERWARERIADAFERHNPTIVVTGDAAGPDEWAVGPALADDCDVYVWRCDGSVERRWATGAELQPMRRWTPTGPRKRWPLQRNAAMVAETTDQSEGAAVVLALHAPWATTRGTAHTVGLARRAGLAVEEHTCPAEHGPRGGER